MSTRTITEAPVLRPTMAEFADFEAYMHSIHEQGIAHGIVKVVPPPEWAARQPVLFREGEPYTGDTDIPTPAQQNVSGQLGVYEVIAIEKKRMHLREFQKAAARALKAQGPRWAKAAEQGDSATIEAEFWKKLTYGEPSMYGADMVGSLFEKDLDCWNLDRLDTILQRLLQEEKVEGVLNSYLYWGMARAFFGLHCEDMDLFSINYLHGGAPKSWYAVPTAYADRVESFAQAAMPEHAQLCSQFLRHKTTMIAPSRLLAESIPVSHAVQRPGEFVVTFPRGYHWGFNQGFNCAEAVNFATEDWLPCGVRASYCKCRTDSVRIDVPLLQRRLHHTKVEALQKQHWQNAAVAVEGASEEAASKSARPPFMAAQARRLRRARGWDLATKRPRVWIAPRRRERHWDGRNWRTGDGLLDDGSDAALRHRAAVEQDNSRWSARWLAANNGAPVWTVASEFKDSAEATVPTPAALELEAAPQFVASTPRVQAQQPRGYGLLGKQELAALLHCAGADHKGKKEVLVPRLESVLQDRVEVTAALNSIVDTVLAQSGEAIPLDADEQQQQPQPTGGRAKRTGGRPGGSTTVKTTGKKRGRPAAAAADAEAHGAEMQYMLRPKGPASRMVFTVAEGMDATGLELGTRCQRSQREVRTLGCSMWALGFGDGRAADGENLVRAVQQQGRAASEEDTELWCVVLANTDRKPKTKPAPEAAAPEGKAAAPDTTEADWSVTPSGARQPMYHEAAYGPALGGALARTLVSRAAADAADAEARHCDTQEVYKRSLLADCSGMFRGCNPSGVSTPMPSGADAGRVCSLVVGELLLVPGVDTEDDTVDSAVHVDLAEYHHTSVPGAPPLKIKNGRAVKFDRQTGVALRDGVHLTPQCRTACGVALARDGGLPQRAMAQSVHRVVALARLVPPYAVHLHASARAPLAMPPPRAVALQRDASRAEEDQQHLKRAAEQRAAKKARTAPVQVKEELGPEGEAWAAMVERCALALKRSIKNIHACYTDNASIAMQLAALGAEAVATILQLNERAEGGDALSTEECECVLATIADGLSTPELVGKNGARAALQAVKYLAGGGVQTKNSSAPKKTGAAAAVAAASSAKKNKKPTPKAVPVKKKRPAPPKKKQPAPAKKKRPAPTRNRRGSARLHL
jgi:jumonji domain-containing protein 2